MQLTAAQPPTCSCNIAAVFKIGLAAFDREFHVQVVHLIRHSQGFHNVAGKVRLWPLMTCLSI